MTTLAFPTFTRALPFTQWEFGQQPNSRDFTSPLNGGTQSEDLPGTRWTLSLRLQGLTPVESGLMQAFMAALRGRANRFTCWDLMAARPQGNMRGTMTLAATVLQGAVTFSLTGATPFTFLRAGDKLNIGGELKIVTQFVGSNGAGQCDGIPIEPPFRSTISGGASIVWDKPTATFRRVDGPWRIGYTPPRFGEVVLDALEDWS